MNWSSVFVTVPLDSTRSTAAGSPGCPWRRSGYWSALVLFLLGVLLLLLGPLVILRADLDDVLLLCFKSGWSLKLSILTRV